MKALLFLALLLVSGCSILGSSRDIPEVKPVEVVTVVKKAPTYHPPLPNQIAPVPVEWTVLNPENLSTNMAEVKRYLRQVLSILKYYRELDNQETETNE